MCGAYLYTTCHCLSHAGAYLGKTCIDRRRPAGSQIRHTQASLIYSHVYRFFDALLLNAAAACSCFRNSQSPRPMDVQHKFAVHKLMATGMLAHMHCNKHESQKALAENPQARLDRNGCIQTPRKLSNAVPLELVPKYVRRLWGDYQCGFLTNPKAKWEARKLARRYHLLPAACPARSFKSLGANEARKLQREAWRLYARNSRARRKSQVRSLL